MKTIKEYLKEKHLLGNHNKGKHKKGWTKWMKRKASIMHKWEIARRGTTFDKQ